MNRKIRKATFAGQFYSAKRDSLIKELNSCFLSELGVGKLPELREEHKIVGAISPHAGYAFSGACASFVYFELAKAKKPDYFLILGVNHHGMGKKISISEMDVETPLGICEVNREIVLEIIRRKLAQLDETAHAYEHSIEVQLPFMQFSLKKFKFVPILFREIELDECLEFAEGICEILREKPGVVLASSDFTHYGSMYGYLPFISQIKENMYKLDREIIDEILRLNFEKFFKRVRVEGLTVCGYIPITILLILMKRIGAKGRLLKYYTSGDVTGDYENSVGYASIIFEV
ncbi:MAG: AmmeMemoRadiSam system protein B [Candidatus Nanoarchaeia archaeon]|nr:AmmeMemoRadiSam system protein B [Candidatus Haiyanarchaeum thermophilum]MCW1303011.1 AmmeMemoRadiSam system protein B [Candidatus Haiyanarchaeum thermophilum]MCW1303689.1 AmmeMemoRadiSam system protein B [Candidatus Haiyanarchaeum thermophilum]MCW1306369.1 AmmeMemoRadiSam system protein B [Candidatus Haiyanarchaeum thermophilum]MCW1307121.1 AmmeMemoRadiSam system protein B [Candidatus Haiyanarchaeum thermophilum]